MNPAPQEEGTAPVANCEWPIARVGAIRRVAPTPGTSVGGGQMLRLSLTLSLVIGATLLPDSAQAAAGARQDSSQPGRLGHTEALVFEDFESVEKWEGFELSREQAKSGNTAARWAHMDTVTGVSCSDIPHDWRGYAHFTFWVYSEKDVGSRFMCIIRSENPATEGSDYWSVPVRLNFTGWHRFGLALREGGGARSPLGWDQVQSIMFTATGWDNTPHPEAVVYIDELKLTNEFGESGPIISDEEFFGMLREDMPELATTRQAAAAGDYARAKAEYLIYMRARKGPVWRFDWREWDKSRQEDYNTAAADRVLTHVFTWYGREADLGPDIEWTSNGFDRSEPAYTPEWTYNLNRFGYWRTLAQVYWATGDEKYASEFIAQMLDWIADQPPPVLGNPNTGPCWRTIEQGIRMAGSWMDAYHNFLGSPLMTPAAHTTFVKSFVEHAQQLTRMAVEHPEHGGNWVTMECNGLAHVGVMFPEFTEAKHWRDVAYGRLLMELDRQVYPDGAQKELTSGYHQVALRNFRAALDPALRNDVEVPEGYQAKLERMYRYNLCAMMPTGHLPPLNDGNITRVTGYLREAYEKFGGDEYLWGATLGAEGKAVPFTSYAFPWAGQYVMRGGWQRDDAYLMFEAGPYGIGHQHEDKLGIFLYAHGRVLLTEPGNYAYDRSKWRRYVLSTDAHNTIMVDGMPQHRRGLRETYEATEPLAGNWVTTPAFDWATGAYTDGYGPDRDRAVSHERTVIFVRPDYFVVLDRLLGTGKHTYSNIFHLDAEEAVVDPASLVARTQEQEKANLALVPADRDGLTVRVVKGQEDPVQGWIPRENHRAVPTPIYEKTGPCPRTFTTLLVPYPAGAALLAEAEVLDVGKPRHEAVAVSMKVGESEDVLLYSYDKPATLKANEVSADARLALVRKLGDGQWSAALMDGTRLSIRGLSAETGEPTTLSLYREATGLLRVSHHGETKVSLRLAGDLPSGVVVCVLGKQGSRAVPARVAHGALSFEAEPGGEYAIGPRELALAGGQ